MRASILFKLMGGAIAVAPVLAFPAHAQVFPSQAAMAPEPADLILTNGKIYRNEEGWAEAVAIAKGVIIDVGDVAKVMTHRTGTTKVTDLGGKAVLPGLHDMHLHAVNAGTPMCKMTRDDSPDKIRAIVRACVAKAKPGEWVVGRGWVNAVFKKEAQDKKLLDEVAPNNPVVLTDVTGHSIWVNSAALKLAKIDRNTPNPTNGVIERRPDGEANGLLREGGRGMIYPLVPQATREQSIEYLDRALTEMLSFGITAVQEAGNNDSLETWAQLYDLGRLHTRGKLCLRNLYNINGVDPGFERHYARRSEYRRELITPDCIKIPGDGVPGDGQTAAMIDPYPNPLSEDRKFGILFTPPEVLKKWVTRFDADGMSVLMHCTGDRCTRTFLDAIEVARKTNGNGGPRHQVGHSNFIKVEDIARARDLGASFEFSAYLYYRDPATEVYLKAIGPERFERYKPVREAIDAGVNVVEGADWPVSASVDPWLAIETLVTRLPPGQATGEKLTPREAITLKEAIDIYTINGAKQFGHADRVGRIRPGYYADLIVLDRNPFEIPITQVHDVNVVTTMLKGQIVYEAKR
jgi:predicted amidohydrolase YtcJ